MVSCRLKQWNLAMVVEVPVALMWPPGLTNPMRFSRYGRSRWSCPEVHGTHLSVVGRLCEAKVRRAKVRRGQMAIEARVSCLRWHGPIGGHSGCLEEAHPAGEPAGGRRFV